MYERTYHRQVLKETEETPVVKKGFRWKRLVFALLALGVLAGVVYAIRDPRLQITTMTVEGTEVVDSEEIRLFTMATLSGKTLWVLPRSSSLLLQTETLEKKLHTQFSRIKEVQVKRDGLRGIAITISEYRGAFLWCTDETQCFFMDEQGIVYSSAPQFSGTAYLKVFSGREPQPLPFEGASTTTLAMIRTLKDDLLTINIVPLAFRTVGPREVRIDFLHNKDIAQFVLDPTVPVQTSLEYLFSGMRTEPLASAFRDSTKKLLYIDVRFPNNIVYRFANE